MPTAQARYWIVTIGVSTGWTPSLNDPICYLKGQQEIGNDTGYHHYQVVVACSRRVTIRQLKDALGSRSAHCEPTRSEAANAYVFKDDTAVPNTRFEMGALQISRARRTDWDAVLGSAQRGDLQAIPSDILIRNYSAIRRIGVDFATPQPRPSINVKVLWGPSGTGKTHRAWQEAGLDAYIKNPNTKWWDGYRGQTNVIIDEFVGRIDISYILTWLDKYPCFAEIKGFSVPLQAVNFWITSNIDPQFWYMDITDHQRAALLRRLNVVEHMVEPYSGDSPETPLMPPAVLAPPNTPNPIRTQDLFNMLNEL